MTFAKLVHTFSEECQLSQSMATSVTCIAELMDEVLDCDEYTAFPKLIPILSELIQTNADDFDPDHARKYFTLWEQEELDQVLKILTIFFHLLNQAELLEISRINRIRGNDATKAMPRPDSIFEAVKKLAEDGFSYSDAVAFLNRLDIQPTLTAHPTEARRRSVMNKQKLITQLMEKYLFGTLGNREREDVKIQMKQQLNLLLLTDEIRTERITVLDEVRYGLYFCQETIWNAIPTLYRDFKTAFQMYYGEVPHIPTFLRYRTWIGGDRDGNPSVTSDITQEAFRIQRRGVFRKYFSALEELREELSISARKSIIPAELLSSIQDDLTLIELDEVQQLTSQLEPFRLKVICIQEKLKLSQNALSINKNMQYSAEAFIIDLELIKTAIESIGNTQIYSTVLDNLIIQARTFGFSLMTMDIRQHSDIHEGAISEILNISSLAIDYLELDEEERCNALTYLIQDGKKHIDEDLMVYSDKTQELIHTFRAIATELFIDSQSIQSYIISMTHSESDILEVFYLAFETGLLSTVKDEVHLPLDVVPLFETIEDLENVNMLMENIMTNPLIRAHIKSRGEFQEIMLGYSDSNKDGGIGMANWALQSAQRKISKILENHGVDFRLFHGRGGSVSRGGGRSNKAILAHPASCRNGRIRMTEQGEVISYRYALDRIAKRHLEQITNAVLVGLAESNLDDSKEELEIIKKLTAHSMSVYRDKVFSDSCWNFFIDCTPIHHISNLPLASRPVSRKKLNNNSEVDFDSLRAIPWVFSWVQTRTNITGWFGMGSALECWLEKDEGLIQLRKLYNHSTFFQLLLRNITFEMARCRLQISHCYNELNRENHFFKTIEIEFKKVEDAYLKISEHEALLQRNPVIERSISFRNPFTDVLNLIQVELLERSQNESKKKESLQQSIFLSINAIAAAMQTTG
ncbi:MAG: phosphoenolpyruvate carboxylase [Candidatus Marinimicrobia bacterium]|nr:phosphoenolpyruvate carboxylase [Candidatus Neomarinimicrobiota bacterium]